VVKATAIPLIRPTIIYFLGVPNLAPDSKKEIIGIDFSVLIYCCIASMIFALLSMIPHQYSSIKFKQSNYKGSLYAGNFADCTLNGFQSEYQRITEYGNTVFEEITKDIYFLEFAIKCKQRLTKESAGLLLLGLVLAGVYTFFKT